MAKFRNGILGPISGKLGPVVGASWKGIAYLRAAPQKRKNGLPTTAQLANRYKFKFLHVFLSPFHPYLINGFKNCAKGKTEINAGFTANYNFITGMYPDLEFDLQKLMLSKGDLAPLMEPVLVWLNSRQIKLAWTSRKQKNAEFNDQLMFVVYSPELKRSDGFIGGVKRVDKTCTYTIDEKFQGHELHFYAAMLALNGKSVSETTYLGRMVAP